MRWFVVMALLFPAAARAAGTTIFDQPFHNGSPNGTGAVVLPSPASGTNTACLTASGTNTGTLRSCGSFNDAVGAGKLRLTTNETSKVGGVFNAVSVPTSQGLAVTFTTYQYGGTGSFWADGLAFAFAAVDPTNPTPPSSIGPSGGSLGYSASSQNGLAYAYLGFGFDEYGNFSSATYQGTGCTNPAYIATTGRVPGQVVVRGPGNLKVGYCALNSTAKEHRKRLRSRAWRQRRRRARAHHQEPADPPPPVPHAPVIGLDGLSVAFRPVDLLTPDF